jgi:hypothetical protein
MESLESNLEDIYAGPQIYKDGWVVVIKDQDPKARHP